MTNEQGRAGFVMASSATDAGNSEKRIREQLVETGHVDAIVAVGTNFFYTRSLPCHLWFLNKGKPEANKNKVLMIDARNIYRVVTSTINDFSEGQMLNLTTIVQLYRGNKDAIQIAHDEHRNAITHLFKKVNEHYVAYANELRTLSQEMKNDDLGIDETIDYTDFNTPDEAKDLLNIYEKPAVKANEYLKELEAEMEKIAQQLQNKEIDKKTATAQTKPYREKYNRLYTVRREADNRTTKRSLNDLVHRAADGFLLRHASPVPL